MHAHGCEQRPKQRCGWAEILLYPSKLVVWPRRPMEIAAASDKQMVLFSELQKLFAKLDRVGGVISFQSVKANGNEFIYQFCL